MPPKIGEWARRANSTIISIGFDYTAFWLVPAILEDPKHLGQLFKFTYQLKTEKVKATKNAGRLFLKIFRRH
ncbi:hypothetical protein GCM10027348_21860 [Hymenobacter tenuis]